MPIFYITDGTGKFVMSAPLGTLAKVFGLSEVVQDVVLRQTAGGGQSTVELIPPLHGWERICIRKLSLEIPQLSILLKEHAG